METLELPPNMKQCPGCGIIIEKISGDNTMMCGCEGRPAGGTMEKALRNGGCGLEFNFETMALLGQGSPGHPANPRQINFIDANTVNQDNHGDEVRLALAHELEFTGFTLEQRVQALLRHNNDREQAVNDLLTHNGEGEKIEQQAHVEQQARRLVLANEMVLMGFDLDTCLHALVQHNNNQESALNWIIENTQTLITPPSVNKDAVPLETVTAPSVSLHVIEHNTRPEQLAREMQRQQWYDNPNRDVTCFRCGGTGVRQTTALEENASADPDQVVVPEIPVATHAVAAATSRKMDGLELDQLPVAVVFRIASGDHDGGELKRATSLERYQSEEYEDNVDDGSSSSVVLQTFSAEELGVLRNGEEKEQSNSNTVQRSKSRRKIKQVAKNQSIHHTLPSEACWLCDGSGQLSKYFGALDVAAVAEEGEEVPTCGICWSDPSEYGLSSSCHHVYCCECLKQCLDTAMDEGNFPAYCPMCAASAGESKQSPCGKIDGAALSFLAQRNVITHDFQFRFMRQQKEIERQFFHCPNKCGRILLEPVEIVWKGDKRNPYSSPGECACGALVCVTCHHKLTSNQIQQHSCPANRLGKDMTRQELTQLHNRNIRKCPKCAAFIQKNEGCHM